MAATETSDLKLGAVVEVSGLQKAPELNGRRGLVTKPPNSDGRFGVWLLPVAGAGLTPAAVKGSEKLMKPANLTAVETEAEKAKRVSPCLKMFKELVAQVVGRAESLEVPVEVSGRRSTAEDPPRLSPVSGAAAKEPWRAGAEALSQLQLCGVQLDKKVQEDSGSADLYSDWLLCQATEQEPLTVLDGFAIKVLDTVGVFDESGDTLCDVDPLLKTIPGFAALSEALNAQLLMEDSLTSGYNNFLTFGADEDAQRMGKAIRKKGDRFSRHAGPGSLKAKAAKKAVQAGTEPSKAPYAADHSDMLGKDGALDPEKMKELMELMGSNLPCGDGPPAEEQLREFMQKAMQGKS